MQTLAREAPETARDRTALKLTLRKRQDKAREYFDELAGKFGRSACSRPLVASARASLITLPLPLTVADLSVPVKERSQLLAETARKVICH